MVFGFGRGWGRLGEQDRAGPVPLSGNGFAIAPDVSIGRYTRGRDEGAGVRGLRGTVAAGVTVALSGVGVNATASVPTGSIAGVSRAAPSSCSLSVGSIDQAGGYVERGVDLLKGSSKTVFSQPGVFAPGATTVLANFEYVPVDDPSGGDGGLVWRSLSAVSGGRLVTTLLQDSKGHTGIPDGVTVKPVASRRGWGGFRALVESDYTKGRPDGTVYGFRVRLYGLSKAGVLYRYAAASTYPPKGQVWKPTGKVGGFGAVRSITLIGQNATSDVLLANTTTGSLLTIRVTADGAMKTTATRLRDRGWNGLEFLVADECDERDKVPVTGLVGIDANTGAAYGYRLGFASGRRTTITSVGRIGTGWKDAAYATQWWKSTVNPMRGA